MAASWSCICRQWFCLVLACAATGCAGTSLNTARNHFYAGRLAAAQTALEEPPPGETDAVLFLMERGTIRHAAGKYDESKDDWLEAVRLLEKLETASASKEAASFLVNDNTLSFRGAPFERTLLRTFLAMDFLAMGLRDDAAVEARNVVDRLQNPDGYPDDAYSRYVAGVSFEAQRDPSSASLQYRLAGDTAKGIRIEDRTGRLQVESETEPEAAWPPKQAGPELVCFVLMGRSPTGYQMRHGLVLPSAAPYAEIHVNGTCLGRSYALANTSYMLADTLRREAARTVTKDIARIAVKETIAYQISRENEALGSLVELVLLAMESPDYRRWETLPMWLAVARVPCEPTLEEFEVVFKTSAGIPYRRKTVTQPISRYDSMFISICRDLIVSPVE